jgi:hypothetical protein
MPAESDAGHPPRNAYVVMSLVTLSSAAQLDGRAPSLTNNRE